MPGQQPASYSAPGFLQGGGEMARLTRAHNWSSHVLGPPESWPVQLKLLVGTMLRTPSPALICWGNDYIQFYNDAFRPILGTDKHPQALGIPVYETYGEAWETLEPLFTKVMGGEPVAFEDFKLQLAPNGYPQDQYFNFSYTPIIDEDGAIRGVSVICIETTQKVSALLSLSESEQRFRTMAESSDVLIAVGDQTGNAVYFNNAWVELTGKSQNELLEFGWAELIHPEDKQAWLDTYLEGVRQQTSINGEFRMRSRYGDYRWLMAKLTARVNSDGSFAGYISSCVDITDTKANEHRLEQVLNMLPAHVVVISGKELVVQIANNANLAYWNRRKEQVVGKTLLEILPELADQPFPEQLRRVLETGEIVDVRESPVKLVNADGSERNSYVDYSYQPLTDNNGKRTGILVMSFEITDRVESRKLLEQYAEDLQAINEELQSANEEMSETQQQLQETIADLARSESRFKYFIQGAPVAIGVLNGRELVIESANDLVLQIWGKSRNVIGMRLEDALPEIKGQPFLGLLDKVYMTGIPHYGNEVLAKLEHNGELRDIYLNFVYQPISGESGQSSAIIVAATEVTEQVIARKKVERAEESLRMAIEAAGLGSYFINVIDRIFYPSAKLKEFFGFAPDEEVPYEAAINQIHPDYRQAAADLVEAAITKGVRFDMEYPIVGHNDGKIRWVRGIGTVQQDEKGINRYFTGVLHEITEQKQDEIRKNDFIGMVSHELKTPLTSLTAIVQVTGDKLKNSEDKFLSGAMDKANIQVRRMGNMINGFLNISRLESGKILIDKQHFDLEALIRDVITETVLTISSHTIEFESCEPFIVNADQEKIGSVITNLISNAVKYSPKGKMIKIECKRTGNNAQVSVTDEGMGIKPQDIDKVFDRYYRVQTHHTRHISGFGIGLYLSAEIIHRHDGEIWVESESGKGSTFYFSLPLNS